MNVSEAGRPAERFSGVNVSANTFGLLRQQPLLGRDFAPGEDKPEAPPVVILGYSVWKNRYASDPAILGRTIKVNDIACEVIGVMPEGMRFPNNADIWRPFVPSRTSSPSATSASLGVFGRLAPGRHALDRAGRDLRHRRPPPAAVPRHQQGSRRRA